MRVLSVVMMFMVACTADPLELRITSYNVMCSICGDGHFDDDVYDDWPTRLPHLQAALARHDADLIGLQELLYTYPNEARGIRDEVADLGGRGTTYGSIYYERDPEDPHSSMDYPDATILYRKSMFEPRRHGFFWLSPTPDNAFSAGFDPGGQLPRVVAWAEFAVKDRDETFIFATTHVDNNSPSQELSAPLMRERLGAIAAGLPVILVGDFNSDLDHPAYLDLTEDPTSPFADTWSLASNPHAQGDAARIAAYPWDRRIDHIFVAPAARFSVLEWWMDLTTYADGTRTASDHRPVHATIHLLSD